MKHYVPYARQECCLVRSPIGLDWRVPRKALARLSTLGHSAPRDSFSTVNFMT